MGALTCSWRLLDQGGIRHARPEYPAQLGYGLWVAHRSHIHCQCAFAVVTGLFRPHYEEDGEWPVPPHIQASYEWEFFEEFPEFVRVRAHPCTIRHTHDMLYSVGGGFEEDVEGVLEILTM